MPAGRASRSAGGCTRSAAHPSECASWARCARATARSPAELLDQRLEVLPALLEIAVGVEARAGRGEQHHLARARLRCRLVHRRREIAASAQLDAGPADRCEVVLESPGGLPDEVAGDAAFSDRFHQALEAAPLERS